MITNLFNLVILSLTISSSNGDYVGEVTYSGNTELMTSSFKLYNKKGDMLYHIINPDAITFFISNSGSVFATNEHNLYLYKPNGEIITLKKLNYPNGFAFSPDNTIFFASDRDGLYGYSMSGEVVYQFNPGRLFACTDQAKRVAVVSNDTVFYYEKGNFKFFSILLNPFVRKIQFLEDVLIEIELPDTTIYLNCNRLIKEE